MYRPRELHRLERRCALAAIAIGLLACQTPQNRASTSEGAGDGGRQSAKREAGAEAERQASSAPQSSGKAVFPVMEHDFGEAEEGASLEHVFKVRNEGEDPLHIKRVRGS